TTVPSSATERPLSKCGAKLWCASAPGAVARRSQKNGARIVVARLVSRQRHHCRSASARQDAACGLQKSSDSGSAPRRTPAAAELGHTSAPSGGTAATTTTRRIERHANRELERERPSGVREERILALPCGVRRRRGRRSGGARRPGAARARDPRAARLAHMLRAGGAPRLQRRRDLLP